MRIGFVLFTAALFLMSSPSHSETLIESARKGDIAAISESIDAGADVNAGSALTSPLAEAVRHGHYDAAALLIAHGADVNFPTKYDGDPVMLAATRARPDLLRLLLQNGANPNSMHDGVAALHMAAVLGCLDCVKALVEAGADVNLHSFGEWFDRTALNIALFYDYDEIAEYLVAHGANQPAPAIAGGGSAKASLKFGIAASPYPPFTSKDASGTWTGWEISVIGALCEEMEENCKVVEVPWYSIVSALTAKHIDVIFSSMSITEERKKTIDFSNMYYDAPIVMVGAKNGDKDTTPPHLSGKTIGVEASTNQEDYAFKYFAPAGAAVRTYMIAKDAYEDLSAGRLDYLESDAVTADAFLLTGQGASCCELKGEVPDDPAILGIGVGAGIRKEDTVLKNKINAGIAALARAGKFEEITSKYPELAGKLILPTR